jgi:16S rRNA (uracil1498-N3)-methyltransferase
MNLILLTKNDFIQENIVEIKDSRLKHVLEIHKPALNKELTVGLVNGKTGKGKVIGLEPHSVKLEVTLTGNPSPPIPLVLIAALPRPKTLKKVLQVSTSMGVKKIIFIESWRVDKSYWNSPVLNQKEIEANCILGLEQAKDTVMPEVSFRKRFKPFVEDELPELIKNRTPLVAHPYNASPCPAGLKENVTLAIGPEGGFTDYEINSFQNLGFKAITLGERILRVEFAIPALIGKIF